MIFRLYFQVRGGHTHCRLFAGQKEGALGKCGDLCFRNEEFNALFPFWKRDIPLGLPHTEPQAIELVEETKESKT